jgi:hypothetical protein
MEVDKMLVGYPFQIRKDNLETRTYEEGSIQALLSELRLFIETEEGEVEHIPDYGVRKRDLLYNTDLDDAILGVFLMRLQEKVNVWFEGLTVVDIYQDEATENSKTRRLVVVVNYLGQEASTEVEV